MGLPSTLNIRPRVFSPTGTLIGAPVAIASIPLTSPSVEPMAIHLTVSSPRCCATSTTSSPPSLRGILIASLISGSLPSVNLISRTALIICVIFPEQLLLLVFISAIFPPFLPDKRSGHILFLSWNHLYAVPFAFTYEIAFAPAIISVSSCVIEP